MPTPAAHDPNHQPTADRPALPAGTGVLNTEDGERGSVLNGYATDATGGWCEYEVVTAAGIEIWARKDLLTDAELAAATAE
jgi:hypothetical protein